MQVRRPLSWLVALVAVSACKTTNKSSEDKTSLSDQLSNPRYERNKDRPWLGWQWYLGARDDRGLNPVLTFADTARALLYLDKSRLGLLTNNLNDADGTNGDPGQVDGDARRTWSQLQNGQGCGSPTMDNPLYRARTLDGSCNDFFNAKMGTVGQNFGHNVSFASVTKAQADFAANGLAGPNPREISAAVMRRKDPLNYQPAPYFNMWSAAWIQFMTHDWFDHTNNGVSDSQHPLQLSEANIAANNRVGTAGVWTVAGTPQDATRPQNDKNLPPKIYANHVTHWWDASQIYGWNDETRARVKNGPYLLIGDDGLLPVISYPLFHDQQEVAAFAENWWVGLALLHTMFAREHNYIVDQLRQNATPPSGAAAWTDDELFDTARLSVAAVIAKIHTIEWTPQLLFNQVGNLVMHANWWGLNGNTHGPAPSDPSVALTDAMRVALKANLNQLISSFNELGQDSVVALASAGPGVVGAVRSDHFKVPFALPEEFTSVYRLHAMLPDYLPVYDASALASKQIRQFSTAELQQLSASSQIGPAANLVPMMSTVREHSHQIISDIGIDNWALSFGLTSCGQLKLGNYPQFMTQLPVPTAMGGMVDMAAMDLLRDRERGVPRFNEFRRQIGMPALTSFDDFIDRELIWEIANRKTRDYAANVSLTDAQVAAKQAELAYEQAAIADVKRIYGGDLEKVDLQVGILAEFSRPHGYVISETQFQIFIVNASRRLFSDRFLTESFKPQFYTQWGYDYVNKTTMADILKRQFPKLATILNGVDNPFDLWNRQRDAYDLTGGTRVNMFQ